MTTADAAISQNHRSDRHAVVTILDLHLTLNRTVATILAPLDILLDDYLVLDEICRRGRCDLADLASHLTIGKPATSRAIQRLVDRSCLAALPELNRFTPPYDVSSAGRDLHLHARTIMLSFEDSLLKRADPGFVDQIRAAIDTLDAIRDFTEFAAQRHMEDPAED